MREILFRGKRLDNEEWVEGFFTVKVDPLLGTSSCFILTQGYGESFVTWYMVDPATIGQYTGLKDKNGKRIFEGDIIECWSEGVKARGTVQQNMGGLWIIYPAWQKHIMWGLCPNEDGSADVEIIGNNHDNPELMEGGEG